MVHFVQPKPLAQVFKNQSVSYEAQVPSLIGGQRVQGVGAAWDIIYPATEEILGSCSSCSKEQVDQAVLMAKNAFDEGVWRGKPLAERQKVFF